jgi:hypothetical protein
VESWGYGRPVIISDKTPWRDLQSAGLGYDLPLNSEVWTKYFEEILQIPPEKLAEQSANCRDKYDQLTFAIELLSANLSLFKK